VIWAIALAIVPLYVWIGEFIGKTFDGHFTWRHWAVAAFGAWSAAGFSFDIRE
jgi:hypothetical protein